MKKLISLLFFAFACLAHGANLNQTVAQGASSAGVNGMLTQGLAATSAPTWTDGTINPVSLTLAGALRVDGSATTQPVSGTFWQATQPVSFTDLTTATPAGTTAGLPIKGVPQAVFRTTFSKVVAANGVDSTYWSLLQTGSGQAISQSGGNLVITTGTTANAETCIRSNVSWHDSFNLRVGSQLSQRIANNNFYVELVDVIGDSLSYSITNATTVVVTVPGTTWTTAGNAGQKVYIGIITGAAGIPMQATIASVSGTAVTLTVAGWPASGSGTCSLFGWNYHHILYTNTTATNANYDSARNGWPSGDTVATINTSASPGHAAQLFYDDGTAIFSDSLIATTVTPTFAVRATRFQNIPGSDVNLYLQIRALNGTTNPASTTTWTVFFASVEDFAPLPVSLQASKYNGAGSPAVAVVNTPAVTVSSGTVTTVSTVTTLANGQTAHSSASTGSPVRVGGRVITTLDTTLAQGDASDLAVTTGQQLVTKAYASSENDWQYATPIASPITNTTGVAIKAAGAASIRNYVTGLQMINTSATASVVTLQDGATVVWTGYLPASMTTMICVEFPTPIRGTAATAMNFVVNTTGTNTFVSAQGYQSF